MATKAIDTERLRRASQGHDRFLSRGQARALLAASGEPDCEHALAEVLEQGANLRETVSPPPSHWEGSRRGHRSGSSSGISARQIRISEARCCARWRGMASWRS